MKRMFYLLPILFAAPLHAGEVTGAGGGVSQITAGTNITLTPTNGRGNVTIDAAGGSGSFSNPSTGSLNMNGSAVVDSTQVAISSANPLPGTSFVIGISTLIVHSTGPVGVGTNRTADGFIFDVRGVPMFRNNGSQSFWVTGTPGSNSVKMKFKLTNTPSTTEAGDMEWGWDTVNGAGFFIDFNTAGGLVKKLQLLQTSGVMMVYSSVTATSVIGSSTGFFSTGISTFNDVRITSGMVFGTLTSTSGFIGQFSTFTNTVLQGPTQLNGVVIIGTNGYSVAGDSNPVISSTHSKIIWEVNGSSVIVASYPAVYVGTPTSGNLPPALRGFAGIYSTYSAAGVTELTALDDAGNRTAISPHNKKGRWKFSSHNLLTNKSVYIDMEELIADLEKATGKQYVFRSEEEHDRDRKRRRRRR